MRCALILPISTVLIKRQRRDETRRYETAAGSPLREKAGCRPFKIFVTNSSNHFSPPFSPPRIYFQQIFLALPRVYFPSPRILPTHKVSPYIILCPTEMPFTLYRHHLYSNSLVRVFISASFEFSVIEKKHVFLSYNLPPFIFFC